MVIIGDFAHYFTVNFSIFLVFFFLCNCMCANKLLLLLFHVLKEISEVILLVSW
jgi:hypothetical protein